MSARSKAPRTYVTEAGCIDVYASSVKTDAEHMLSCALSMVLATRKQHVVHLHRFAGPGTPQRRDRQQPAMLQRPPQPSQPHARVEVALLHAGVPAPVTGEATATQNLDRAL